MSTDFSYAPLMGAVNNARILQLIDAAMSAGFVAVASTGVGTPLQVRITDGNVLVKKFETQDFTGFSFSSLTAAMSEVLTSGDSALVVESITAHPETGEPQSAMRVFAADEATNSFFIVAHPFDHPMGAAEPSLEGVTPAGLQATYPPFVMQQQQLSAIRELDKTSYAPSGKTTPERPMTEVAEKLVSVSLEHALGHVLDKGHAPIEVNYINPEGAVVQQHFAGQPADIALHRAAAMADQLPFCVITRPVEIESTEKGDILGGRSNTGILARLYDVSENLIAEVLQPIDKGAELNAREAQMSHDEASRVLAGNFQAQIVAVSELRAL